MIKLDINVVDYFKFLNLVIYVNIIKVKIILQNK